MANIPKSVRKDAKLVAAGRRKSGGKTFTANTKAKVNPFKKDDVKKLAYITDYSVKHSDLPKRNKEFHAARKNERVQGQIDLINTMDAEHREAKAWKKDNPNYVYPGGTGDRK